MKRLLIVPILFALVIGCFMPTVSAAMPHAPKTSVFGHLAAMLWRPRPARPPVHEAKEETPLAKLMSQIQKISAKKVKDASDEKALVGLLDEAVKAQSLTAITILLLQGVDVNGFTTTERHRALHTATDIDNPNLVRILIKAGAKVNCKTSTGERPIDRAANKGFYCCAEELIAAGTHLKNPKTRELIDDYVLQQRRSQHQILMIFADMADFAHFPDGILPLVTSFLYPRPTVRDFALAMETPILGHALPKPLVRTLVLVANPSSPDLNTSLRQAMTQGLQDLIDVNLWDFGILIHAMSAGLHGQYNGCTALDHLLSMGSTKMSPYVQQLIDEKADVNCPCTDYDGDKIRPIDLAASKPDSYCLQALIKAGARVHADPAEDSALHRAAENFRTENVRLLFAAGADVNHRDKYGKTPIFWAALAITKAPECELPGKRECLCLLISHGAVTDLGEWTPREDFAMDTEEIAKAQTIVDTCVQEVQTELTDISREIRKARSEIRTFSPVLVSFICSYLSLPIPRDVK